jgi:phage tail sheath protein FI
MSATAYQTPGVYYETVDASSATIPGIRTDIAGFVGIAVRGPVDVPVPVESWRQFEAHFGGCTGVGYLAYVVRAFFENGGRRCWVTRVASRDPVAGASAASAVWSSPVSGNDVWRIEASSVGTWGNALTVRCVETHRAQTVVNLAQSTPEYTVVANTTGFMRGTLVRLSQQAGGAVIYKVVSDVDPVGRRLLWVQDRPERRLPYDAPLDGIDPNQPLRVESVEYTLTVRDNGRPVAVYEGLSLIPEHPRYGPTVLAPLTIPSDVEAQQGIPSAPFCITVVELRERFGANPLVSRPSRVVVGAGDLPPSTATFTLQGGRDGLALLSTYDFVGEEASPEESDEVRRSKCRGLRALAQIQEVAMVAIPDIHIQPIAPPAVAPLPKCIPDPCLPSNIDIPATPAAQGGVELPPIFSEGDVYRVQADLIQHCEERRDRFAILDAPYATAHSDSLGVTGVMAWRTRFDSKFAALYYPWTIVVDPLRNARTPTRAIPPCGHVAGQYARTDITVGVHKAPANTPLEWAQDVTAHTSTAEHGLLNSAGINVLRSLPGRALRILGARTVSSDPDWRYVNVRRLIMMIQKAIDLATQWAVFEPNNHVTRSKLRLAVITYLSTLWQQGALAGASMDEAFFVKCDEENNSADDRANGRLILDIGVAPAHPFEFIVLRVWRAGNELEFAEAVAGGRGH